MPVNKTSTTVLSSLITGTYFVFFFLSVLLIINPQQSYCIQQPMFLFDKTFLYGYLAFPGGLIKFISLFFSQFYFYPVIGALIITGIALAVWLFTYKIIKFFSFNRFPIFLQLFPITALFYLHSFSDTILAPSLILLCTLIVFYYHLKITGKPVYLRLSVYLVSSVVVFYAMGGSGLLLFQVLCLTNEITGFNKKRSFPVILTILLSGLFPYLAARFLFFITPEQSYLHLLIPERFFRPGIVLYVLYIYYPLLVIICSLIPKERETKKNAAVISSIVQIVIIGVSTCLLFSYSSGSKEQFASKIKYLAYKGEWEQILSLSDKHYSNDRLVNFDINRALYFMHRLPYDLFRYPNFWGQHALFLGAYTFSSIAMDNSELYFDLGHIRAARQWAYEAQTISENSPRVLKMLALTNIVEGDYNAANMMLQKLNKSIIHKKWARYYLQGIKDTTIFKSDSLIQEKRRMMPSDVHYMDGRKVEVDLLALLKKNPDNKMAFEFLMAYLMLSDQIEKLNPADEISYLKQSGYIEMPQIYQEALMVCMARKGSDNLDSVLGDYKINPVVINGYTDYLNILDKYQMDRMAAREELYYKYGSTYWYYQQYVSPFINNKDFLEKMIEQ